LYQPPIKSKIPRRASGLRGETAAIEQLALERVIFRKERHRPVQGVRPYDAGLSLFREN